MTTDDVRRSRDRLLSAIAWTYLGLSIIAYVTGIAPAIAAADWPIITFNTVMLAAIALVAVWTRAPVGVRTGILLAVTYTIGLYYTYRFGPLAAGPLWLFATPILAAALLGRKLVWASLGLITGTIVTFGFLLSAELVEWADQISLSGWIPLSGSFVALDALLALSVATLLDRLVEANAELEQAMEEKLRAAQRLREAQKLESLGLLAGGVAHDFNNLLGAVINFTTFALEEVPVDSTAADDLDEVLRAANRGASLTQQLLAFSRRRPVAPQVLSPNTFIADLQAMLDRLIGEKISLVTTLDEDVWPVEIDPGGLEQIVMNLVLNARDAMPDGGRIDLETHNVSDVGETDATGNTIEPGDYVELVVRDEGCGMNEETQQRLFEPFYSTKSAIEGTGLGLATVYGIVRQAAGNITLDSSVGEGTTFRVLFPRSEKPVATLDGHGVSPILQGTERILVVEDEEPLRRSTVRALRRFGYDVLEASDGENALSVLDDLEGSLDIVVSDVVMPQMSGAELGDELRARFPDVPIIYVSGYPEDVVAERGVIDAGVELLYKPLTPRELARQIRKVLDDPAST